MEGAHPDCQLGTGGSNWLRKWRPFRQNAHVDLNASEVIRVANVGAGDGDGLRGVAGNGDVNQVAFADECVGGMNSTYLGAG